MSANRCAVWLRRHRRLGGAEGRHGGRDGVVDACNTLG